MSMGVCGHEEDDDGEGESSAGSVKRKSMSSRDSDPETSNWELLSAELMAASVLVSVEAGDGTSNASQDDEVDMDGDEARLELLDRLRWLYL